MLSIVHKKRLHVVSLYTVWKETTSSVFSQKLCFVLRKKFIARGGVLFLGGEFSKSKICCKGGVFVFREGVYSPLNAIFFSRGEFPPCNFGREYMLFYWCYNSPDFFAKIPFFGLNPLKRFFGRACGAREIHDIYFVPGTRQKASVRELVRLVQ